MVSALLSLIRTRVEGNLKQRKGIFLSRFYLYLSQIQGFGVSVNISFLELRWIIQSRYSGSKKKGKPYSRSLEEDQCLFVRLLYSFLLILIFYFPLSISKTWTNYKQIRNQCRRLERIRRALLVLEGVERSLNFKDFLV